MSSEQTTSDLRGTAQDYKRDAAHKHKWALGTTEGVGRAEGKPRPHRPSETDYNFRRRESKSAAVASLASGARVSRKHDMLEGTAASDESSASNSDEHEEPLPSPADGVMYSFDAKRSPTQGSQILNVALAKAVERFEERETLKLVKNEYDVLDTAGEIIPPTPDKKARGAKSKASPVIIPDADDDYEFV